MQATDLRDYVKVYPGTIPPLHCDRIVQLFEQQQRHARLYHTDAYNFTQLELHTIGANNLAQAVVLECNKVFHCYMKSVGADHMAPSPQFEAVRIKRYEPHKAQEFRPHIDNSADTSDRFLSYIVYLTDNAEGRTVFPNLGLAVACEKGAMLVFPPTWQYLHAGERPIDSNKYILVTSMMYPRPMIDGNSA